MNKATAVLPLLLAAFATGAAQPQNQIRARLTSAPSSVREDQNPSTRSRTVETNGAPTNDPRTATASKPAWGDSAVPTNPRPTGVTPPRSSATEPRRVAATQPKLVKPTTMSGDNAASSSILRPSAFPASSTSVYRVGAGDVLDVRLANMPTRESTLFTVMKDGALEYPLLAQPLQVAGLTPDEIARRLTSEIKVIRNARALVSVRDYASKHVMITGAVDNPGRKVLRREAMPLFALLAQAFPRSDATTVTVVRNGKETNLSLKRSEDLATLVLPGDVIRVSSSPARFVYIGGEVASTGEKELRDGMTLTQLLLAAGGVRHDRQIIAKISRRDASGLLKSQEHKLRSIEEGKSADPLLQAGDRIEVRSGM